MARVRNPGSVAATARKLLMEEGAGRPPENTVCQ
jgi:hypothetical protein